MKRDLENGDDSHPKRDRKKGKGKGGKGGKSSGHGISIVGLGQPRKYAFKALCSDTLAANLIGKEGKTRAQIEEDTGTSVWISKRHELYPHPQFRLLILHADEPGQVLAALESVVPRLIEVADREKEQDADSALVGKDEGEYIFWCALPSLIRGKLIGTKGANIKELRERTGAKIFVDNDEFSGHHATRVIGSPEKIREVLRILNEAVQEAADTEDFASWIVCQPEAAPAPQDRRRSPPRDRYREPPRDRDRMSPRPQRDFSRRDSRQARGVREEPLNEESYEYNDFPRVPDGPPLDVMARMVEQFPRGEEDINLVHSISCSLGAADVPSEDIRRFIEERTDTKVTVEGSPEEHGEQEYPQITIVGPLFNAYLAHMLMMQRVHERRHREEAAAQAPKDGPDVEALRQQVEALQRQLQMVAEGQNRGGGRRR